MNGNATNSKKRLAPEAARKAFKREHDDVWMAIAGQANKIALARAIQDRADKVRDKLYDHYGNHKDRWIKHEMARLSDANFRPRPELRPRWAGLTWDALKREATINVANRQSARFRRVNAMERRSLEALARRQNPKPKRARDRTVKMSKRDAMVLDTIDRARNLREKARRHFDKTRGDRIGSAVMRGAQDPKAEVGRQEVKRMRQIDQAERNIIAQTVRNQTFNRAAQRRSGPSMAM